MAELTSLDRRIAVDVGIVVADMTRSLRFYHELLGLAIVADIPTSLIGQGRMVQLQHGASRIKLVAFADTPTRSNAAGISAALGYRYMTLLVADIAVVMGQVEQYQIPVVIPVTQLGNGATIAMVADPDGNVVEFVQEAD